MVLWSVWVLRKLHLSAKRWCFGERGILGLRSTGGAAGGWGAASVSLGGGEIYYASWVWMPRWVDLIW